VGASHDGFLQPKEIQNRIGTAFDPVSREAVFDASHFGEAGT
jgi:hypothetical protein